MGVEQAILNTCFDDFWGPWGSRGVPWGGFGGLWRVFKMKAEAGNLEHPPRELPRGSPGAPWGVPGGSRDAFWAPRGDPDDRDAHSGGFQGGSRSVEKTPETTFLRSRGVQYTYFQGFKHVHFVDLKGSLGAPGGPWNDFGRLRGLQGWSWGGPGGVPRVYCWPPGGSRGPPDAEARHFGPRKMVTGGDRAQKRC